MIYKGPEFDKPSESKKSPKKGEDDGGKSLEINQKKQAAALALMKDFIKNEKKKLKPKILWFASGCLLLTIIIIIASTVIPLLLMVSEAKDTVGQNLKFIKASDFDQAFAMCDKEFFAEDYIIERITDFAKMLRTPAMNQEFREFADLILKEKSDENYQKLLDVLLEIKLPEILNQQDWLDVLNNLHLHGLEKLCDYDGMGNKHFKAGYTSFNELLKDGSFEVQEFSTAQKQATVQGEIFFGEGKSKFFTYVLYYDNDDEIWYIIRFRFGQPVPKD